MSNLRAITLRIPQEDYNHLEVEAEKLQIRPGTLARILLHSVLNYGQGESEPQTALKRLQNLIDNK